MQMKPQRESVEWKDKAKEENKNIYSRTSRLEIPEELQPYHNHEQDLFLAFLLLFDQYKRITVDWWLDLT
jgi:hypothetical protein